jgi:hypothetical protein
MSPLIAIAESHNPPRRTFKAFRGLAGAIRLIQKHPGSSTLRFADYSKYTGNVKDKRYIVNRTTRKQMED